MTSRVLLGALCMLQIVAGRHGENSTNSTNSTNLTNETDLPQQNSTSVPTEVPCPRDGYAQDVGRYCAEFQEATEGEPTAAFSEREDRGKDIIVRDGNVEVDGLWYTVNWIGPYTEGSKNIFSVQDELGGTIQLTDYRAFENPAAVPTCPRSCLDALVLFSESCNYRAGNPLLLVPISV